MRMDLAAKDLSVCSVNFCSTQQVQSYLGEFAAVTIGKGNKDGFVRERGASSHRWEHAFHLLAGLQCTLPARLQYARLFKADLRCFHAHAQRFRALVRSIHLVNIPGRGNKHLFSPSQDQCLKHVYSLCDIGHNDLIGMPVEDVEGVGGYNRITDRILLVEEGWIG